MYRSLYALDHCRRVDRQSRKWRSKQNEKRLNLLMMFRLVKYVNSFEIGSIISTKHQMTDNKNFGIYKEEHSQEHQ